MSTIDLNQICTSLDTLCLYIAFLNTLVGKTFDEVCSEAREKVPELANCELLEFNARDKGKLGKLVENNLFGQKPNCDQNPDLKELGDIKTTRFKKFKYGAKFNAKERLTITNIGNDLDYESYNNIKNSSTLEDSNLFKKLNKFLLFGFTNDQVPKFLGCVYYKYDDMSSEDKLQFEADFLDIQNKINSKLLSQKGQQNLHVHKHGTKKNPHNRAVGLKNKIVTKIFAKGMNYEYNVAGRSIYFNLQL